MLVIDASCFDASSFVGSGGWRYRLGLNICAMEKVSGAWFGGGTRMGQK
jgi:Na+/pantothenate symporter